MNEKRKQKRFELNVLKVHSSLMFTKNVKVVDISMNGISLESTKCLNIGHSYGLRLADEKKTFSLKGNVVWSSLIESRKGLFGNVTPIYKIGMNFIDMSPEKAIEFLNFILENQRDRIHEPPVSMSESGSEMPRELSDKVEHIHKWHKSVGYNKAHEIAEHARDQQIKEAYQGATTCDVSLTRLIIPQKILATAGKALTLYVRAIATSKFYKGPVTVTLKAVPVGGVKVAITPADITEELNKPTNFCFSSTIICAKSGTWPIKWTAKIGSSKVGNTAKHVLTGITHVVCRNAECMKIRL